MTSVCRPQDVLGFGSISQQFPLWDVQDSLFDAESYWVAPERVHDPVEEAEPESIPQAMQLGYENRDRGRNTHEAFRWRIHELGGMVVNPPEDPGGGIAADVWIRFPHWTRVVTVQVRGSKLRADGGAEFNLGRQEQRKHRRYYGRADMFALAVWEGDRITTWYLIPAPRLRLRTTLKVTPGHYSQRLRKDRLEPERFRDVWPSLADKEASAAHDSSWSFLTAP